MRLKIIFLFIMFSVLGTSSYGQSYNFPVRPGDDAWKAFDNSEDRYSACQIPDELLKSMSTEDLITTCLNYPLIITLYAHDNLQTGLEGLSKSFNGIEELINRKDSGTELMKVYSKMAPENYESNWSDERKGNFTFKFDYLETFLAQRTVIYTLSLNDKKELVELCLDKYEGKKKHISIFGSHGTSTSTWVIGRILDSESLYDSKGADNELADYTFLERGLVIDFEVIDTIIDKGRNFVK